MIHGNTDEQWQDRLDAAVESLKKVAQLGRQTNYTALNLDITRITGLPPFNFSTQGGRTAMADLLGDVVKVTYPEHQVMLSALVMYLNENKPGVGFYNLAVHMGILDDDASESAKERFWIDQYNKALDSYKRGSRRLPRT